MGMPGFNDRIEILEKLGRKLGLEIDFDEVGKITEGFTGADLQGLVAAAQLLAIHERLDGENGVVPDIDINSGSQEDTQIDKDLNQPEYVIVKGKEHVGVLITRSELDRKVKDLVHGVNDKTPDTSKSVKPTPKVIR